MRKAALDLEARAGEHARLMKGEIVQVNLHHVFLVAGLVGSTEPHPPG
jgi:hypothetical protein